MTKNLLLLCLICVSINSFAQKATIIGQAIDSTGTAIPYVNIGLKGTPYGSISDERGNYQIRNIEPGSYTVVGTFIGYEAFEETVNLVKGETKEINFTLRLSSQKLKDIIVTARRNNPNERLMPSISKLPVRLKYQTQSITVLDNKLLQEQQLINLDEAINYAPGFNLESTRGNQFPKIQVRGASATLLINGLRLESDTRGGDGNVDFNALENIQFINGSSSIGLGNASVGGAINFVTKSAQFKNEGSVFTSVGSFGRTNTAIDKQWNFNDKIGLRLNGSYNRGETFREDVGYGFATFSPSIAYKLDDKTKVSLDYIYRDDQRTRDVGQLRVERSLLETVGETIEDTFRPSQNQSITDDFVGFSDDFQRQLEHSTFLNIERDLGNGLKIQATGGMYDKDRNSRGINTRRAYVDTNRDRIADGFVRSSVFQRTGAVSQSARVDLLGQDIQLGRLRHNFQVSADFYQNENYVQGNGQQSRDPGPAIDTLNLLNPVFNSDISSLSQQAQDAYYAELLNTENRALRTINGITLQDQINFTDRLRATLGLRYTWGRAQSFLTQNLGEENETRDESESIDYSGFSPSFGLFYDLTPNIVAFASYSNTFDETSISPTRVDVNGQLIGNEVFEQAEIGIRSSFFENALGANLTFYNIFNNNVATLAIDDNNDPLLSPTAISPVNPEGEYFVPLGQQQRRGFELSLQGKITDGLNIYSTYAFYEFSQAPNAETDAIVFATDYNPTHSGSIITNYQFQQGLLKDFRIGAGMVYTGERTVTTRGRNAITFNNPAFSTYTLTAGYSWNQFEFDAKLNNVTDELQYNFFGTTFINPISPFNYDFRITYKF